jgi:hypothetical protein
LNARQDGKDGADDTKNKIKGDKELVEPAARAIGVLHGSWS